MNKIAPACLAMVLGFFALGSGQAQTPPSSYDKAQFSTFQGAVFVGDLSQVKQLIERGADLEGRDPSGRTALHLAAYESNEAMFALLIKAGSDVNAFEKAQYDVVTIAAVANDIPMLELALASGGDAKNTTSPYLGTALIAAAHLGHAEVVDRLLAAGSKVDHVNNLGWTALLEAIILGDGSPDYVRVVKALLASGAVPNLADNQGVTPLSHARREGYEEIVKLLQ